MIFKIKDTQLENTMDDFFGKTCLCKFVSTNEIAHLNLLKLQSLSDFQAFSNLAEKYRRLNCPFFLNFIDILTVELSIQKKTVKKIITFFEYESVSLSQRFAQMQRERKNFGEAELFSLWQQMSCALQMLDKENANFKDLSMDSIRYCEKERSYKLIISGMLYDLNPETNCHNISKKKPKQFTLRGKPVSNVESLALIILMCGTGLSTSSMLINDFIDTEILKSRCEEFEKKLKGCKMISEFIKNTLIVINFQMLEMNGEDSEVIVKKKKRALNTSLVKPEMLDNDESSLCSKVLDDDSFLNTSIKRRSKRFTFEESQILSKSFENQPDSFWEAEGGMFEAI